MPTRVRPTNAPGAARVIPVKGGLRHADGVRFETGSWAGRKGRQRMPRHP
ncbi:MAG TPA: hypothetical protein VEV61_08760 [Streptosporangiaceae bacterium]|nr:hypothetical protein [Streptosporangiaceae bacterium]